MKPFVLDSSHTSMSGVFYPTGHVFALFPTADLARQAADALDAAGARAESAYASPEVVQKDIVRTIGSSDAVMPSVGADGDFVRRMRTWQARGTTACSLRWARTTMPKC